MADKKPAKKDNRPDILFISGSPRNHTCMALIDLIEQGAQNAGAKTQRFALSKKRIDPCVGCGGCNATGACVLAGKAQGGRFKDDYLELKAVLERVDAVAIVAPLYFAGPPAQLKALYDRMQPYWVRRYLLGYDVPEKRSAQLFVVGGGGDAHGHAPLVGSTKSAMAVAGFNLEKVNNFIGFRVPKDVPVFPREEEISGYSHAQLAQIKRMVARQKGFVQRAIDAGGAFARFVVKKKQANDLAEQLARVEAELEALRRIGDAERPEQGVMPLTSGARSGTPADRKGDLQAEIDLEYSNLISRTPRDGEYVRGETSALVDLVPLDAAEGVGDGGVAVRGAAVVMNLDDGAGEAAEAAEAVEVTGTSEDAKAAKAAETAGKGEGGGAEANDPGEDV
jgi:multimeric flavodoxin WrbA